MTSRQSPPGPDECPAVNRHPSAPLLCLALSIIVLIFLAHSYYLGGYTADDSFITFRYARNLADGYGPVFNTGERVEGYTSFGWVIIFAFFTISGWNPWP